MLISQKPVFNSRRPPWFLLFLFAFYRMLGTRSSIIIQARMAKAKKQRKKEDNKNKNRIEEEEQKKKPPSDRRGYASSHFFQTSMDSRLQPLTEATLACFIELGWANCGRMWSWASSCQSRFELHCLTGHNAWIAAGHKPLPYGS